MSWIDDVKEGDRFSANRPVPNTWLEQESRPANLRPFPAHVLHLSPPRLGIAIDLDQLRALMAEFITETDVGQVNQTVTELLFSGFLIWLRGRQETRDV